RFGGERSRQRVLEPAASPGRASTNPWLQRRPVVEAGEQDDRFGSAVSSRAITSSCRLVPVVRRTINRSITSTYRLLPVARRAINSSITRSYWLLPVARRAFNGGITSSYRLLRVARRLIARGATSSRVRLTPMARRATSITDELVRAAGRSVRNAVTPTPRDQGPARLLSNETLSVPHPSGASAAAGARQDCGPCYRSILHYDEASMKTCDMCGCRRTRLWNPHYPRLFQCHACPADLCGLCGLPRVRHTLQADRLCCGPVSFVGFTVVGVLVVSFLREKSGSESVPGTSVCGAATGDATSKFLRARRPRRPIDVGRSPPAAPPRPLPAVTAPTAPAGGPAGFGGASVAAPPSTDPSPMDVDDPTPATPATPGHATGFIFNGNSAIGTGVSTTSTGPTTMAIASHTSTVAQLTPFAFTGLQTAARPTFGGGAAPAAAVAAAAMTTATTTAVSAPSFPGPTLTAGGTAPHGLGGVATSSVVPTPPNFTFGAGGAYGGSGAITGPPAPASISASIATTSTAPTPMVLASPSSSAVAQPTPFAFTGIQPAVHPTFGGGAAPAATAAATTTATTTAASAPLFPAPTLTAGGTAPHGLGGASSVVPAPPKFTFGAGGANGGNGAVATPPPPAGASASVARAPLTGGTGSAQGTGRAPLPVATAPVGFAVTQGGISGGVTRIATSRGRKRRAGD
ncbi:unnamed protein product, partial [Ectocarpus fasciculatus]